MSEIRKPRPNEESDLIARVRAAARQEQFLEVVSAGEARIQFEQHLDLAPLPAETVSLADARTRVLAHDVVAAVDAPPFDRANVDGFAVRAADTVGASDGNPKIFALNKEVIACGNVPMVTVDPGSCTTIATGGVTPRGADAVVMIEQTELIESNPLRIELRRAASPGQFISYAGSDIARGETLLRRGVRIGSREIGMLAASGLARIEVVRRPKVAVLSTGDELVEPGNSLKPAGVYDSNSAIIAAAVSEAGGHIERSRRSLTPCCVAPRQARHSCARRGAQTRKTTVSCGCGRQTNCRPAWISNLGDLHLSCFRRSGDPCTRWPGARSYSDDH